VMRANQGKLPVATFAILLVTAIGTGSQFVHPQVLSALERTPTALAHHEWWRLITPLLVHADGWPQICFNFPLILVLGSFVERTFGRRRLVILYLTCGFIGESAGYAWQPRGAGASVAGAGLLGSLPFWLLGKALPGKLGGLLLLVGAAILTFLRDIHGPPVLAGAGITWIMEAWTKHLETRQ